MQEKNFVKSFLTDAFKYRWLMFGIVSAIYFLTCLHRITPTVIARDLAEAFSTDATALGIIASAYFFPYSAVQPPVGILSDTIGPKRVIAIFTLIAFIGGMVFATASSVTMAVVGRALIGAGVGGVFIPTLKIFSRWYKANEFATLTGIFLSMGSLGGLAASLPLTFFVIKFGWRGTHVALAMVSLIFAVLCWKLVWDRPEDKNFKAIVPEPDSAQSAVSQPEANISTLGRIKIVFSTRDYWLLTGAMFFSGGAGLAFQGLWAVPYLLEIHEISRVKAGGLLMMMPLGFSVGSPIFGLLADRLSLSRRAVLLGTMSVSLALWTLMLTVGHSLSPNYFYLVFFLMGICGGGSLPMFITATKEMFPPWLTGTAVGLMNPAGFFAAALFQPFSGFLLDFVGRNADGSYPLKGYQTVFTAFLISFSISFIFVFLTSLKKQEDRPQS